MQTLKTILLSLASAVAMPLFAVPIFLTTTGGQLLRIDSSAPGTVTSSSTITGLQTGTSLTGIDFRPADGLLYGVGSDGRLYSINSGSGLASQIGPGAIFTSGSAAFGVDFNPVPDRLRVVGTGRDSYRINQLTGALVLRDSDLTAGSTVAGVAYTNNLAGATQTTLFGIDSGTDSLVMIGGVNGTPSPNGGIVTTIGLLGVDTTNMVGFDISSSGVAFASLTNGQGVSSLYSINLSSGAATSLGALSGTVTGLAIAPVPEPTTWLTGLSGLAALFLGRRRKR